MHPRDKKSCHDPIAWEEALRREARSNRPSFSDPLHDRIMQAVRVKGQPSVKVAATRPRGVRVGLLATAATLLAILCAVGWGLAIRASRIEGTGSPIVEAVPATYGASPSIGTIAEWEATDRWVESIMLQLDNVQQSGETLESEWVARPLTSWNHDAQVLAEWILDPLALAHQGS